MFRRTIFINTIVGALLWAVLLDAQENLAQSTVAGDGQGRSEYSDEANTSTGEKNDDADYLITPNIVLESGDTLPRSENSKRYHSEIESVLSVPDFAQKETVIRRRFKDLTDETTREGKFPEWIIKFVELFEGFGTSLGIFANILEILVWSLVIGVLIYVVTKYRTDLRGWVSTMGVTGLEPDLPTSLFGLDIKQDSMPDDVVMAARNFWSQGDQRQAVSILLRSSSIKLLHEHDCRFFSSDTEAECCDRIDQSVSVDISVYMRLLVAQWQGIAYAHTTLSDAVFDQLCLQWSEVFR